MKIAFFGSSLVSAYWNGAATYYRGIIRALYGQGHEITFYEPDAYDRQAHRDLPDPPWAQVVVYPVDESAVRQMLRHAEQADVVIKTSGVGVFDEFLEEAVLELKTSRRKVIFWDVDAPATLDRMDKDPADRFVKLVPRYDAILTYGGGAPVVAAYKARGAVHCAPVYNALDPTTHFPVEARKEFAADVAFLGNRLPDREQRVDEFFFKVARALPQKQFILGGSGWQDKAMPENVHYVGHVYTADHNAFNCSSRVVLNINRDSMARYGFSPATRIFEAAGSGACLATDAWEGIENFLEPGREVLIARNGEEMAALIDGLSDEQAQEIGEAGLARVLSEHTYGHRIDILEALLSAPGVRDADRGLGERIA